ncbi:MAG: DUF89 family protein [Candidatus Heimdallarchaeota archaeon]|nr:DUF89 family protein [Candidatus Heimdallarchaeota archaeon]
MKVVDECYECILNRARGILDRSDIPEIDPLEMIENIHSATLLLTEEDTWLEQRPQILCPAQLGTVRQQYLERVGLGKTYEKEKELGNSIGSYLISKLGSETPDMKTAIMYSLFGNGIEFDVGGIYEDLNTINEWNKLQLFMLNDILMEKIGRITNRISETLAPGDLILFLLDNVGEHYLDNLLINYLIQDGYQVEIVVKGSSVLNDISIEDSLEIFQDVKIWNTGNSDVGLFLSRIPAMLHHRMNQSQLLIIKGMAQFETLSSESLPTDALFLFKAKCDPVAQATETINGDFVVHYQPAGEPWL